jgi:hypothetical protein
MKRSNVQRKCGIKHLYYKIQKYHIPWRYFWAYDGSANSCNSTFAPVVNYLPLYESHETEKVQVHTLLTLAVNSDEC